MLTIGLIDQYPVLRTGLKVIFNNEFDGVVIMESQCIKTFYQRFPDVLPDIIMVGNSVVKPLKLMGCLKNWYKDSKIIIYDEERLNTIKYLRVGASGVITTNATISEFVIGIKCVLGGKVYVNHGMIMELLMNLPPFTK